MPICPKCGEDNPERARFCLACATPLTEAPLPQGEERKIVSVLFADLVGFTARSEEADPEDVRGVLRPYHAALKREIERYGGVVEKFIGDAVMGVFGAPVAHEDDAERAVRAALRIQQAVGELNEAQPGLDLSIRAAVNTGEAVVTIGASPELGESMVAGDVVNTASRLQTIAPEGGVVVADSTYQPTKGFVDYERLDPVEVKGKAGPIPIWLATGAKSRYGVEVQTRPATPFVGREDELELLKRTFARAVREPSIQLVTVTGEPGVGKSRLLSEFFNFIDNEPDLVFWRQGRCPPYGEGITFWALGEVVKAQAGILESDVPDEASRKLAVAVEAVVDDPTEWDWFQARLAPLVGLVGSPGAGAVDRQESFTAWRRFLEAIAVRDPLVVVLEDLHWADPALLEFVEHLVDYSVRAPILAICNARPELYERRSNWGGGKRNASSIALAPLTYDETRELVTALLSNAILPADVQAELLERSGGNPLFAEEFVRMLSDQGVLQRTNGEVHLAEGAEIRVPDTVQALIAARLDTVPMDRKVLLHDAAVVGKVFWAGAVSTMSGIPEPDVRDGLHELSRKEMVRPARTSSVKDQVEYAFWHLLVRDVAYSQIPRAARVAKHRAAAEWIQEIAGERVADHAEMLASHYQEALLLARALGSEQEARDLEGPTAAFLIMAGDRALGLDAREATRYYEQALDLMTSDHPDRANALLKAARAIHHSGRVAEAQQPYQQAVEGFRARGEPTRAAAAMVELALLKRDLGETAPGRALLQEAIEVLEREPPGPDLALAYVQAAREAMLASRFPDARVWADKAIVLGKNLGRRDIEVEALMRRGGARHDLGEPGGREDMEQALGQAVELGFVWIAGIAYNNLGDCVWFEEGSANALKIFREGLEFSDRRGSGFNSLWIKGSMAFPLIDAGYWDDALSVADEIFRWERETGASQLGLMAGNATSWVLTQRGETEKATRVSAELLPRAREAQDPQMLWTALGVAAQVARAQDNDSDAVALLEELAENARRESYEMWGEYNRLDCIRLAIELDHIDLAEALFERSGTLTARQQHAQVSGRAFLAEAAGHQKEALGLFEESVRRWTEFGSVPERGHALLGQGRCLLRLGKTEADSVLQEAARIYGALGARPFLESAELLLRNVGGPAPSESS
jgi:class 3 adenylate cyclase/tetratricopeptide (TPR) repeat protein